MANIRRAYCPKCKESVPASINGANHVLHLLLSLVTLGAWIPVWIVLAVLSSSYRCTKCGATCYGSKIGSYAAIGALCIFGGLAVLLLMSAWK
jgi:hypothetical protein